MSDEPKACPLCGGPMVVTAWFDTGHPYALVEMPAMWGCAKGPDCGAADQEWRSQPQEDK